MGDINIIKHWNNRDIVKNENTNWNEIWLCYCHLEIVLGEGYVSNGPPPSDKIKRCHMRGTCPNGPPPSEKKKIAISGAFFFQKLKSVHKLTQVMGIKIIWVTLT